MASKKKLPSFEIPDAVREAGQSGWVYRTETGGAEAAKAAPRTPVARRSAAKQPRAASEQATPTVAPRPARKARRRRVAAGHPLPDPTVAAEVGPEPDPVATPIAAPAEAAGRAEPPADTAPASTRGSGPGIASGLIGFGLHMAAVPFVVPLYVTAAISRRLGLN
jgi:hypothetical protein